MDKKHVGVIEAKRDEERHRLRMVKEQSKEYAEAKHLQGNVQKTVSKRNLLRERFYILSHSVFHISTFRWISKKCNF